MKFHHFPILYKIYLVCGFFGVGVITFLRIKLFDPLGRTLLSLYVGLVPRCCIC